MLKIGEFSKLSLISVRMLRYYDELGLLIPKEIDEFTGYRYYSPSQLTLANKINSLKDMGFKVNDILNIIENKSITNIEDILLKQKNMISDELSKSKHQLLLIENAIKNLREDDSIMDYNVVLKNLPERYVISVREIISNYSQEGKLWERMMPVMESQKVEMANPCYSIAVFHDAEYKENDVDVEIQMAVKNNNYSDSNGVVFKTVPSEKIASVTFKGSYDNISKANEALANWITDNNYAFNGPMFNIYHVSPAMEQDPDKWITEVCLPIK